MTEPGVDHRRLQALLGDDALAWLVDRCRRRLARGHPLTGTVTLADASPAQRQALARLLGRPPGRGASLTVSLPRVAAVLADAGAAPDLATAVQAVGGPVTDRHAAAADHERRWARVWEEAEAAADTAAETPAIEARAHHDWLARLRADGLLRRLAGDDPEAAHRMLQAAEAVLAELPAGGESRSVLAARSLGDGHALDDDRPVATLVARAVEALTGRPGDDRRELWARVGVAADPLTSRVVALGLPGDTASATGRMLATLAGAGEPATVTLRQLVGDPPALAVTGRAVFVCENVSVVATTADRLGPRAAPLVCTDGHPSTAVGLLLDRLAAGGARLFVHADLDWAGLRIAAGVIARTGAAPWRLRAADYAAAVGRSRKPLAGTPTTAPWDEALPAALHHHGLAVEEELVLEELLVDLAE